jgi:hypothetical protein
MLLWAALFFGGCVGARFLFPVLWSLWLVGLRLARGHSKWSER